MGAIIKLHVAHGVWVLLSSCLIVRSIEYTVLIMGDLSIIEKEELILPNLLLFLAGILKGNGL